MLIDFGGSKIENLVIVESPAKAKTLEKFLGKGFVVKSSFGHIRDLEKKNFGIDKDNNYEPKYIISAEKKKVVAELKKAVKQASTVWLATDEDREGEAIAWHLAEVLKLDTEKTKRIVFHEITKKAVLDAVANPRNIDQAVVNAQTARRILDRLVGFELSPLLWRKIKPKLSAGRVQSVAVKLIVEKERDIIKFKPSAFFKVAGDFKTVHNDRLTAELNDKIKDEDEIKEFLEQCKNSEFKVANINVKPSKKSPSPPFTTSTLQQEASRKLSFSVAKTMLVAQKLYEAGKITYMRTDSLNISELAIAAAKKSIIETYGKEYSNPRRFRTKSKGAQEAHEAIRPSYLDNPVVSGSNDEKRLYQLIWKRTIASQMSDARLKKTKVEINISKSDRKFYANGEVLEFDGFLKVYLESTDDENALEERGLLPRLKVDDKLDMSKITATERFTRHSARFTEASLVKKLEELGIGRPSTYAPTISTVQKRGYIVKENRDGNERLYRIISLKDDKITSIEKKEIYGAEKMKLFPTDIGMVTTDFLSEYFINVMNYNFTAKVEEDFDKIADSKIIWHEMIDEFYKPFHKRVEKTLGEAERSTGERKLGVDPKSGEPVTVRIGKFGPLAQIGIASDDNKPRFASLRPSQHIETITLEEALDLFKLPRELGKYEDKVVVVAIGRFGPYVRHDSKFVSLKKDVDDPMEIDLDRAIELIEEKRKKDREKIIKTFDEDVNLQILNGRWGPYIAFNKENYKIPKETDAAALSFEDCKKLIKDSEKKGPNKKKKIIKKTKVSKKK